MCYLLRIQQYPVNTTYNKKSSFLMLPVFGYLVYECLLYWQQLNIIFFIFQCDRRIWDFCVRQSEQQCDPIEQLDNYLHEGSQQCSCHDLHLEGRKLWKVRSVRVLMRSLTTRSLIFNLACLLKIILHWKSVCPTVQSNVPGTQSFTMLRDHYVWSSHIS